MDAAPKRSRRALLWTATTYFGEGLPWSVLHQLGTEFLTTMRASSAQIAATSNFHLAVAFKFVLSPIVDSIGTKRAWMIATQLVLGVGMIAVGAAAAASSAPFFAPFWLVASLLAIIHATHDVACDGYYMQGLSPHDQALYTGVRIAAFRGATYVGSSVLVVMAASTGWMRAFSVAGALMVVVGLVNAVVAPRVVELAPAPRVAVDLASKRAALVAAYKSFAGQPQAVRVIAFMLVYRLGDIMMFTMSKPLLRDIGVDLAQRGYLSTPGITATIVGGLIGGGVIARLGLRRTLVPILYLQNLAIPIYIGLAVFRPAFNTIVAAVLVEQFIAGVGSSAFTVFVMNRSRGPFATSHFAFATAVVALASTAAGNAAGWLDGRFGHVTFFTLAFVASWPSLVLVWFVPKGPAEEQTPAAV